MMAALGLEFCSDFLFVSEMSPGRLGTLLAFSPGILNLSTQGEKGVMRAAQSEQKTTKPVIENEVSEANEENDHHEDPGAEGDP
jgi:hypothetical protein